MKYLISLFSLLLAGCDQPPEPVVTPPTKAGIPTHVPTLAPQVEALRRADKADAQVQESADRQRAAIEAGTR